MLTHLQKTLKSPAQLQGVGLQTGLKTNLCIKPAEVNSGIKFKRTDVNEAQGIIEANYKNVCSTILCIKIANSYGVSVSTIEHLMAAFYGEGIDNVIVEIDAPEVPIMDGSAIEFVKAIRSVGIREQNYSKKFIKILKKVEIKNSHKYISIEPHAKDFIIDFEIIYKNKLINTQMKEFNLSNGNLISIYDSRTFCLFEDIEQIKSKGLAKGGSLENAIVVKENKVLNKNGLRHKYEFVNHKILDCLGDFMLSGHRVLGRVKCVHGGHQLTNDLLRKLFSNKSNWEFERLRLSKKELNQKDNAYLSPIAANA